MKTSQFAEVISRRATGMRTKQNLDRFHQPRVSGRKSGMPLSGCHCPDAMSRCQWSGWMRGAGDCLRVRRLAEFALQAGFLAPLLFRAERFGKSPAERAIGGPLRTRAADARSKAFWKGERR